MQWKSEVTQQGTAFSNILGEESAACLPMDITDSTIPGRTSNTVPSQMSARIHDFW